MFFNELEQISLKYQNVKATSLRYEKLQERALERLYKPVYIRDLVVTTENPSIGERSRKIDDKIYSSHQRLCLHIAMLFNLANEDHRAHYCRILPYGGYQLKPEKQNHVTRLSTAEFSFYTRQPLTLEEFQSLVAEIENMAKQLEPNVHILLSSFAVRDHNDQLINMSLFIEGGPSSVIHSFAKTHPYIGDVTYSEREPLFSPAFRRKKNAKPAEHIATSSGIAISTNTIFNIRTLGGAGYLQAVDVCLDHLFEHSKMQLLHQIYGDTPSPDEFMPLQIEHCITSCSVNVKRKNLLTNSFLQVDPTVFMSHSPGALLGEKFLSQRAKQRILTYGYLNTKIVEKAYGYKILNPVFGSHCRVEVLKEKLAGRHSWLIEVGIREHNEAVCIRRRVNALQRKLYTPERIAKIRHENSLTSKRLERLKKNIIRLCQSSTWEKLIKLHTYREKRNASALILHSMAILEEMRKEKRASNLDCIQLWKKSLIAQLESNASTANGVLLVRTIQQTINRAEEQLRIELNGTAEESNFQCSID